MLIATVDIGKLKEVLRQFPSTAGTSMDSFIEDQARLLVSSSGNVPGLVQVTPPHHGGLRGNEAKKTGEKAVARDIAKVYANPGVAWDLLKRLGHTGAAAAFWKSWQARKIPECNRILERAPGVPAYCRLKGFDKGTEHQNSRGSNGRVRSKAPRFFVSNPEAVKRYVRKTQRKVGLLASSIPTAVGSRFGSLKGVPGWVKKHRSTWGYVRESRTRKGRTITLGMSSKGVKDLQRRFVYVLDYRLKAIKRQLPYLVRKLENELQAKIDRA